MSTVTSLTEERDQLKEILEGLRQEKKQLTAELEANMEMVIFTHFIISLTLAGTNGLKIVTLIKQTFIFNVYRSKHNTDLLSIAKY